MPFASFNPTNPRTTPWNFQNFSFRIGNFEKCTFFESAILNFFFRKKKFFLLNSYQNTWKFIGLQGISEILMITLVCSSWGPGPTLMHRTVCKSLSEFKIWNWFLANTFVFFCSNEPKTVFKIWSFKLFFNYNHCLKIELDSSSSKKSAWNYWQVRSK